MTVVRRYIYQAQATCCMCIQFDLCTWQYLTWRGDNTTIHDFYSDSLLIEWEQSNMREIITRNNSITGVPYR